MTLHAFSEYIKYKWRAKNRHGIHSPFVYAFIEDGLMKLQGDTLLQTINNYFPDKHITVTNLSDVAISGYDNDSILIIKDIHVNKNSTATWDALRTNTAIRISIDMYSLGLLFFNTDVKEQQHFILKYPV